MNDLNAGGSSDRTASAWHTYQQHQQYQADGDALDRHEPEQLRTLQQFAELDRVA